MKRLWRIILAVWSVVASGCGHSESFRVDGRLDDGATINLKPMIHSERGTVGGITPANTGAFAFEGAAPGGALLEIYDNDYRLQARFPVHNGKDYKVEINRSNRYATTAKGDPGAEAYTAFLASNADAFKSATPVGRNALIADYIRRNPESEVSVMLLWGEFDVAAEPALADSLAQILGTEARSLPAASRFFEMVSRLPRVCVDSVEFRIPGGRSMFVAAKDAPALFVFSDSRRGDHKQLADSLRDIASKAKPRGVKLYDLSCDPDTATWRRTTRPDSATWTQGWLEGGPAAPRVAALQRPSLPFYIVVDAAGNTIARTTSADSALNLILTAFRP